ncbi:hypothetical protein LTR95_010473 [Oleoguttula sp. CCFEE 5521]
MALDYGNVAAREIIKERCRLADRNTDLIRTLDMINPVLRLTEGVVVKFGIGVMPSEACALQFAHDHLDPMIVKVPKMIQFFSDESNSPWSTGYLVMEFMSGTPLDEVEDLDATSITRRLTRVLDHLHTFTHTRPGPLGGGPAHGLLWSEYSSGQEFSTLHDLQAYLNRRLAAVRGNGSVDVTGSKLSLCHLDFSARNILLSADGSITLLDWGCAGFYPSIFETWSVQLEARIRPNPTWQQTVSALIARLTGHQKSELEALSRVYVANQKMAFSNPKAELETSLLMQAACGLAWGSGASLTAATSRAAD